MGTVQNFFVTPVSWTLLLLQFYIKLEWKNPEKLITLREGSSVTYFLKAAVRESIVFLFFLFLFFLQQCALASAV